MSGGAPLKRSPNLRALRAAKRASGPSCAGPRNGGGERRWWWGNTGDQFFVGPQGTQKRFVQATLVTGWFQLNGCNALKKCMYVCMHACMHACVYIYTYALWTLQFSLFPGHSWLAKTERPGTNCIRHTHTYICIYIYPSTLSLFTKNRFGLW
jgi:hypothetical protein